MLFAFFLLVVIAPPAHAGTYPSSSLCATCTFTPGAPATANDIAAAVVDTAAAAPVPRLWPDVDRQSAPTHILQLGHPRTATTLQYEILCLLHKIVWEGEHVECRWRSARWEGIFTGAHQVIKSHGPSEAAIQNISAGRSNATRLWVFTTKAGQDQSVKQRVARMNKNVTYEASVETVGRLGVHIIYEYQQFFNIPTKLMDLVYEYMRYWDILRVCCGPQMSEDWRQALLNNTSYRPHHSHESPAYPACEMYDLDKVEELYLNSVLMKRFSLPSKFDGTYCSRCSANIQKRHLKFNEHCD